MAAGQLELASVRTAAVSARFWPVRQVAHDERSEGRAMRKEHLSVACLSHKKVRQGTGGKRRRGGGLKRTRRGALPRTRASPRANNGRDVPLQKQAERSVESWYCSEQSVETWRLRGGRRERRKASQRRDVLFSGADDEGRTSASNPGRRLRGCRSGRQPGRWRRPRRREGREGRWRA